MQGHIWRTGFENNELKGVVFEDVPEALEKWHASGIKVTFASYVSFLLIFFLNDVLLTFDADINFLVYHAFLGKHQSVACKMSFPCC